MLYIIWEMGFKNVINIHAVIYNISNKYKLIEANTELTLAVKKFFKHGIIKGKL